jgi:hypothetical protein
MKPKGIIYTHSLNVPPTDFKEGFPGVTKQFEWFDRIHPRRARPGV